MYGGFELEEITLDEYNIRCVSVGIPLVGSQYKRDEEDHHKFRRFFAITSPIKYGDLAELLGEAEKGRLVLKNIWVPENGYGISTSREIMKGSPSARINAVMEEEPDMDRVVVETSTSDNTQNYISFTFTKEENLWVLRGLRARKPRFEHFDFSSISPPIDRANTHSISAVYSD